MVSKYQILQWGTESFRFLKHFLVKLLKYVSGPNRFRCHFLIGIARSFEWILGLIFRSIHSTCQGCILKYYKVRSPFRECVSTGAAGTRTRRFLGHHLLYPLILRLLLLCAPADFEAQSSLLLNRLHPQIQIPNACPVFRTQLRDPHFFQNCGHFQYSINCLCFDVSWCGIENDHNFERNEDRATVF